MENIEFVVNYDPITGNCGELLFRGNPEQCKKWVYKNAEEREDWFYFNGNPIVII